MTVLVAGVGNVFRRDDGFGSEVARALLAAAPPPDAQVVDYGIRGVHLAFDLLAGYHALVVVDALPGQGPPGTLVVLRVDAEDLGEASVDAHAMAPAQVLSALSGLGGDLPPTLVVGCVPGDVTEGVGLSPEVAAAVEPAAALVRSLVTEVRSSCTS